MSDPLQPTLGKTLDSLLTELRGARGIVVLCDLGAEPGKAWRVTRGDFAAALREINPSCAITAAIPLGEGEIEREGDRRGLITPGRRSGIEWASKNPLKRLDPAAIAAKFPIVDRLLTFRGQLTTMRAPLGGVKSVYKLFRALVGDAESRRALRAKIGYREGFAFDAEAVVTGEHGAIVGGVVQRFQALEVSPGETYLDRLMRELRVSVLGTDAPDELDQAVRSCCQALFLQLLHPAWENEDCLTTLQAMRDRVDDTLSRWLDVILHEPRLRALELSLRALDRLAGEATFDLFQCSRAALLDPPPVLEEAIAPLAPQVICAMHALDPRSDREIEALRGWISRASALQAVFLADAPLELAGPLGDPVTEGWAALSEPGIVGRFALFPQRRRARLPYGHSSWVVRQFNYYESFAEDETACLGASAAAFMASAVASIPAGSGPWIGSQGVPGGETAILELHEDASEPIDMLALFPLPPQGDDARRRSLGLIDFRVTTEPGSTAILAPSGVLRRLPDGRFAPTSGPPTLPFSASLRPARPGYPPRSG